LRARLASATVVAATWHFHVDRAATPDGALAFDAGKGLDRPLLAMRHDDVQVAEEGQ